MVIDIEVLSTIKEMLSTTSKRFQVFSLSITYILFLNVRNPYCRYSYLRNEYEMP